MKLLSVVDLRKKEKHEDSSKLREEIDVETFFSSSPYKYFFFS